MAMTRMEEREKRELSFLFGKNVTFSLIDECIKRGKESLLRVRRTRRSQPDSWRVIRMARHLKGEERVAGKGVKIDMLGFAEDSSFNYDHVTGHGRKKRRGGKEQNEEYHEKDERERERATCDLGFKT